MANTENQRITKENKLNTEKYEALENQVKELLSFYETLQKDFGEVKTKEGELEKKYVALTKQLEKSIKIQEENEKLTEENKQLKADLQAFLTEFGEQKKYVATLTTTYKDMLKKQQTDEQELIKIKKIVEKPEKGKEVRLLQLSALLAGEGKQLVESLEMAPGRYLLIKNVKVREKNEFALVINEGFSFKIVEATETLDIEEELETTIEEETPTARISIDILLLQL